MSLIDKKVASRYAEKELSGTAKLKLTENIMTQIDFLHEKVGGVEWSGVLVYKILAGSIEDYANLEVEVIEILPMDVGTSGYTEYELDSADDYTFSNLCDRVMMDPTLKIGHIHTHHNMGCFFSGTDTQELHDNAPNHNYYLSLIVNFKDHTNWCSKIALVGEESQEGSIISKFKGTSGEIVEKKVDIKKSTEILYTLKMDIEAPVVEERELTEFEERVVSLNKDRGNRRFPTVHATPTVGAWERNPSTGIYARNEGEQGSLFNQAKTPISETHARVKVDVSDKNIREFANKVVSQNAEPTGLLTSNFNTIDTVLDEEGPLAESNKQIYMDSIFHSFDDLFEAHFGTTPTDTSRELVAKKLIAIYETYSKEFEFLQEVIEELDVNFVMDDVIPRV